MCLYRTLVLLTAAVFAGTASAQSPPVHPSAEDRPYEGTISLQVDATDIDHKVLQVRESLPVKAGRLTLLYPRWMPGEHGPTNEVKRIAGLKVSAGGRPLAWQRDPSDVHVFRVDVPAGTDRIELEFQHLLPRTPVSYAVLTSTAALVPWGHLLLYPAGHRVDLIAVEPSLRLPTGWQQASALRVGAQSGQVIRYENVSVETLIDSPVLAGRYVKRYDLDPGGRQQVWLTVFGDEAKLVEAPDEAIAAHRRLVAQADKLFGARHFAHYDFLLLLGESADHIGLEHHQSSENGFKPRYFSEWKTNSLGRDLLPHEFAHSWNGKFRRPRELWAPDYNTTTRNSLLWVYEGQTEYWGRVLAARSGIIPSADSRANLAYTVAWLQAAAGREWRNLQDTTHDEIIAGRNSPLDWYTWQRFEDYYDEGALIWLDVDTKIRELSGGRRSLDDFARGFFGVEDGRVAPLLYDFDDVIVALNRVQPLDWASFLRERLDRVGGTAPLEGLERSGWRLVFTDQQSDYAKARETEVERDDFFYSLGLAVGKEGKLQRVAWNGPAFKAGLAPDLTLLAVNLRAYKAEVLRDAITAAKTGGPAIELLLKEGDDYRNVRIDYRGGLRYPVLERIPGSEDRLAAILAPR